MDPSGHQPATPKSLASSSKVATACSTSLDVEAQSEAAHAQEASEPAQGQPLTLVFQHLTFEVSSGRRRRRQWRPLLSDVSGAAAPGELVAVLGPSGSG